MSGTSLDGLDICYAKFQNIATWEFEILKTETIPYSPEWKNRLQNAILLSAEDLLNSLGYWAAEYDPKFAEQINKNGNYILNILKIEREGVKNVRKDFAKLADVPEKISFFFDDTFKVDNKDLLKKEFDKAYKKLSLKYKDMELKNKIKQKLYQKGFNSDEINSMFKV